MKSWAPLPTSKDFAELGQFEDTPQLPILSGGFKRQDACGTRKKSLNLAQNGTFDVGRLGMMTLSTVAFVNESGEHLVSWRTGIKNFGTVKVVNVGAEDSKVVAELLAIRYLLLEREVFKRKLYAGTGIKVEVSSPVIRKLLLGTSKKSHLFVHAKFLHSRLSGITIDTRSGPGLDSPMAEMSTLETIDALEADASDVFETPAMGAIRLTKHAIDQYQERLHSGDPQNAAASLVGRLSHPDLKKQPVPANVKDHKYRKYGDIDQTEVWGHLNSQMHYVVVREASTRVGTVVTVYRRHPDYC